MGLASTVPAPEEGDGGMETLTDRADQALYQAKDSGRDQVRTWTAEPSPARDPGSE
jgi:PleD family two-component response regulator